MGPEPIVIERLIPILAPDEPRDLPGQRSLKLLFRASHVLTAGVYTAAHILDAGEATHDEWFAATLVSGVLILLVDIYESASFLLQVRGFFLVGKLAFLTGLRLLGLEGGWTLGALLFASVVSSHAPGSVRHYQVLGRGRLRSVASRG
jgi:hypothetical protein